MLTMLLYNTLKTKCLYCPKNMTFVGVMHVMFHDGSRVLNVTTLAKRMSFNILFSFLDFSYTLGPRWLFPSRSFELEALITSPDTSRERETDRLPAEINTSTISLSLFYLTPNPPSVTDSKVTITSTSGAAGSENQLRRQEKSRKSWAQRIALLNFI